MNIIRRHVSFHNPILAPTLMAFMAMNIPTVNAQTAAKDYSKGFQQLYSLGLPDVSEAKYVRLDAYDSSGDFNSSHAESFYEIRFSGNAWMLEETPNIKGRFVVGLSSVKEVSDNNALNEERRRKFEEMMKTNRLAATHAMMIQGEDDNRIGGAWKEVDAGKDAERARDFLRKRAEKESGRHDSWSYNNGYGHLMLRAAHFHRMGLTNEANEIAGLLFAGAGDSRKVVVQCVDIIANNRYLDAISSFRQTGDWKALATELDAVAAKFASWKNAQLVKRLAGEVGARAAQTEPPPIEGADLTDEDKKLADDIAGARRFQPQHGKLWILPPEKESPPHMSLAMKNDPVFRLQQRGMKSIPLLLAMLKDGYMTPAINPVSSGHRYSMSDDEEGLSEEKLDMMYRQMRRPITRGDIAIALLQDIVPRYGNEGGRDEECPDPDDIHGEVKTWHDANKDKKPLELARQYFLDNDRRHRSAALQYLINNGQDSDFDAIEKHFLESERLDEIQHEVSNYIQQRGDKAKDFLAKYEALLTTANAESSSDNKEDMFRNKRLQKMMKQQMEQLKGAVSAPRLSLKETVEKMASGDADMRTSDNVYAELSKVTNTSETVAMLLDAAISAVDGEATHDILNLVMLLARIRGAYLGMGDEMIEAIGEAMGEEALPAQPASQAESKTAKLLPATHAAQWRKLLADKRRASFTSGQAAVSVGDVAAEAVGALYSDDFTAQFGAQDARHVVGNSTRVAIFRSRAEAILAGKEDDELPKFPALDKLSSEEKTALADKILNTPDAGLADALKALKPGELLALAAQTGKNDKLNARLAPLAQKVRSVTSDDSLRSAAAALGAVVGKQLNPDTPRKIHEIIRDAVTQNRIVHASINREFGLEGIDICLREVNPAGREARMLFDLGQLGRNKNAVVEGEVAAPKCSAGTMWNIVPVEKPKQTDVVDTTEEARLLSAAVAAVESDLEKTLSAEQTEFWKTAGVFCAGTGNVCRAGTVTFIGKPVLQPPKKPSVEKAKAESAALAVAPDGQVQPANQPSSR